MLGLCGKGLKKNAMFSEFSAKKMLKRHNTTLFPLRSPSDKVAFGLPSFVDVIEDLLAALSVASAFLFNISRSDFNEPLGEPFDER